MSVAIWAECFFHSRYSFFYFFLGAAVVTLGSNHIRSK